MNLHNKFYNLFVHIQKKYQKSGRHPNPSIAVRACLAVAGAHAVRPVHSKRSAEVINLAISSCTAPAVQGE